MNQKNGLQGKPRWKVLRQWAIVVPVIAVVLVVLIFLYDGHQVDERQNLVRKSLNAGYEQILDSRFTKYRNVLVEDVEYVKFEPARNPLRKAADANILIRKDAKYIDGADGNLELVEIYGREERWVDEKNVIVEPYAIIRASSNPWDIFFMLIFIVPFMCCLELVLLLRCLGAYRFWKAQENGAQKEAQ